MIENFSFDTIKDFDKHIELSIPCYADIHIIIDSLLQYFIKDYINIYDIGCSTGALLKRIDSKYRNQNISLIGYDICKKLLSENDRRCIFINDDVLKEYINFKDADIIFSVFTMCFINLKYRQRLFNKIYSNLNKGGVFIFTDKVYSSNAKIQDIFTFLYYDFKKGNFSFNDILQKEYSLRKIQQPLTDADNVEMLRNAGFKQIDSFWQYFNFKGYLCLK